MTYKEMNIDDLNYEIKRVHVLLATSKKINTKKQNHKYLQKLEKRKRELMQ